MPDARRQVLSCGLIGGHAYSVIDVVSVGGKDMICCRNPWATGEWTGRYSDQNKYGEWTPALKKACKWQASDDGNPPLDLGLASPVLTPFPAPQPPPHAAPVAALCLSHPSLHSFVFSLFPHALSSLDLFLFTSFIF